MGSTDTKEEYTLMDQALPEAKQEAPEAEGEGFDGFDYCDRVIFRTESIGGVTVGMDAEELEQLLGAPETTSNTGPMAFPDGSLRVSWFYRLGSSDSYELVLSMAKTGDGWFVNEIRLSGGDLTLASGIGIGSEAWRIGKAYDDVTVEQFTGMEDDVTVTDDCYTVGGGLRITARDGLVRHIALGPWLQDPPEEAWETEESSLLDDLSAETVIIRTADGTEVTAVDKAAKGICTVMTVSEPEEVKMVKTTPELWLDFGNGTVAAVYGHDDTASVYITDTDGELLLCMEGRFLGLDSAVAQALKDPNAAW